MNAGGLGTADHTPQAPITVLLHAEPFAAELFDTFGRKLSPDELGGVAERGIIRIDDDLCDHGCDLPCRIGAAERIIHRLLDHVANPARRRRHQYAEGQWRRIISRDLVAYEL